MGNTFSIGETEMIIQVKQTIKASLQGRYRIKRVLMFQDPGLQEFPSDDPIPAAQSQVSFKTLLRQ